MNTTLPGPWRDVLAKDLKPYLYRDQTEWH
jgi:hypothetical protein